MMVMMTMAEFGATHLVFNNYIMSDFSQALGLRDTRMSLTALMYQGSHTFKPTVLKAQNQFTL